ncbi:tellurite resistance protein TelA [Staphylococcus sp. HMSC068D03]|uniref:toxic anion resistance protein n=1 Tax=Staphylococcus TaxID=1279 RepID=UPI0008A5043B|nr:MULTISPECIES: toxic anion resistance protein [Staphylococcus]MCH4355020.1 toxic anion resistance protein [Staphylococcus haemolyticus]OFN98243.1 tellurite resistance protein TelA [Staphylococcus sp. HMSC077B09]OFV31195.1 tellurite resistance protein TelA [Staphylococcus sp. HMSC14D10]OHP80599.1 tellurite resistance protein TelA [Staphylococcus sp. HMSC063A11]OHQ33299.1 tellurite resistance protein TelA [Staphylococcus sp. HMSC068D03]
MPRNDQFNNSHPLDDYIVQQQLKNLDNNSNVSLANQNTVLDDFQQQFSDKEMQKIESISQQIKPLDNDGLLSYGSHLQENMSQFSHKMLDEVQTKDIGPVGDSLNQLMTKLKAINPDALNPEKQSKLKRFFKRTKASINEVFSRMQSVSSQIDRITIQLDKHKNNLSKDIKLLDGLYQQNKDYFDDVNLYIAAAKRKKYKIQTNDIPKLQEHANQTGNQMDIQAVADMEQFVDRLDKRIYDLQLSRQIAIQTAPQIRMIQNVNQALAEKIQSSILTSIPLWKNQMAIALTLMRQRNAVSAQRAVTDTTNDLLTQNAAMLKQNAIETATENERGIVDIETLKTTQSDIIETIEQTLQIQQNGRQKRKEAEKELVGLEDELKQHLLSMKKE